MKNPHTATTPHVGIPNDGRLASMMYMKAALGALAAIASAFVAQGDEMCYGQRGNTSYSWATAENWLNNSTSVQLNRMPTQEDDVFIWANILKWTPLAVEQGTAAQTKAFSIGYSAGASRTVLFEIQDGGTMTNSGDVVVGRYQSGDAGGIATVRSGGEWMANANVTVGAAKNNRNLIMVEDGGRMTAANGEFVVGGLKNYCGTVTNRGALAVRDFFPGGSGVGTVVNEGTFTVANKLTIGRYGGSEGHFHQKGGAFVKTTKNQPLHVGYAGTGVFEVDTPLTLLYGDRLALGANGGHGELIINPGGSVTGVQEVAVGAQDTGGTGVITLAGGEMVIATNYVHNLLVGKIDDSGAQVGWGTIRGYGKIGRTDIEESDTAFAVRLQLCGQVIADGGDLDLGLIKTVGMGGDENACGTNGWYAVNKGRLILPRRQDMSKAAHVCVGEYVTKGTSSNVRDISLVNSIQLRLYRNGAQLTDKKFHFAMLYAADRDDIPGELPCKAAKGEKTLAVWRLGHFSDRGDVGAEPKNPVAFDEVSLRFRYDGTDVNWERYTVVLFRYDGTSWECVGTASADDPTHIATAANQPSYDGTASGDNWNIGWYAVVRKKMIRGMEIVVR